MSVNVAAGSAAVPSQNNTGSTLCVWDATETVGPLTASPPSGQSRIDLITVHPRGNDLDGGTNNDFILDFITGTPATTGSQTVPPTPAGQLALARILVPGASAAIVAGNITDVRPNGLGTISGSDSAPIDVSFYQGSKAPGTYTGATVTLPAPRRASRFVGQVNGYFGYNTSSSTLQFDIRRADNNASIMQGGLSQLLGTGNSYAFTPLPAMGIHVPSIAAGATFPFYPYYIIGGPAACYFEVRIWGQFYPL